MKTIVAHRSIPSRAGQPPLVSLSVFIKRSGGGDVALGEKYSKQPDPCQHLPRCTSNPDHRAEWTVRSAAWDPSEGVSSYSRGSGWRTRSCSACFSRSPCSIFDHLKLCAAATRKLSCGKGALAERSLRVHDLDYF